MSDAIFDRDHFHRGRDPSRIDLHALRHQPPEHRPVRRRPGHGGPGTHRRSQRLGRPARPDHVTWLRSDPQPVADPWILLTAVALATKRLRVRTTVTPVARRRPTKLARETITLDRLSGDRLTLGVGLGSPIDDEFAAVGEPSEPQGPRRATRRRPRRPRRRVVGTRGERPGPRSTSTTSPSFRARSSGRASPVWVGGTWPKRAPVRRALRWDGAVFTYGEWDDVIDRIRLGPPRTAIR